MLELLARRHRLPARSSPPATVRVNLTITEPDGTTTKLNSPGAAGHPAAASTSSQAALVAAPASAAWVVLAGSLPARRPARVVRRAGRRPARRRRPGRRRHQRRAARGAGRRVCPTGAPAPDEAQRRGARVVHRRRRRRARGRPVGRRRGRAPAGRPRRRARCWRRSAAHGAVLVTADGAWHADPAAHHRRQHRRRRRLQPLRLPPRRRPRARPRRTARARRRLRQRGRRAPRHDHPATPGRSRPELVHGHPPRHSPPRRRDACPTSSPAELVRLDADLGTDKHDVIRALAAMVADAGRTTTPTSSPRTRSPASPPPPPGCPAASRSRTAAPRRSRCPRSRSRGCAPGRLRRQGRPGRPGVPDRRARRRRRHPPQAAHQAGPRPGQEGLHRRRSARRDRRRRSSTWSADVVGDAARRDRARAAAPTPADRRRRPAERSPWSPSPPARPASRTPTWPPRPSRPRPSGPASTSPSRPRARPAPTPLPPETIAARRRRDLRRRRRRPRPRPVRRQAGRRRPASSARSTTADAMIAEALRYADDPNAPRVEGAGGGAGDAAAAPVPAESWGARTRRVLMTGVSYMIPFVAAGGLLIALGFLLGGYEIVGPVRRHRWPTTRSSTCPTPARSASTTRCSTPGFFAYLGALFFIIGKTAFALLHPGAGRLHRLRDRRPARHRARLRDGRPGRRPLQRAAPTAPPADRLPRRHRRRRARRRRSPTGSPAGRCRPGPAA